MCFGGVLLAVQVLVGIAVAQRSPRLALVVLAASIAVPIVVRGPARLGAVVFPAVYLSQRLGGESLNLSYADAALVVGVGLCLFAVPWTAPLLRRVSLVFVLYAVALLFPLMANPTRRAFLEFGHRGFLVLGAICIGAAVGRSGGTRAALRLYLLASLVASLGAAQDSLRNGFAVAEFWSINKNAGGFLVAGAVIIVVTCREIVALWRPVSNLLLIGYFAGLLAFQSRGAAVALAVVLLLSMARVRRANLLVPLLGLVALGYMAKVTLDEQAKVDYEKQFTQYGTIDYRIRAFDQTLDLWQSNRAFGVGIRFWNDPEIAVTYTGGEPHNLLIAALGETGAVGMIAVSGFAVGMWWVLRRRTDPLGICARYLVVAQTVSGLADIYWRAGTGTLPWLVVGLAVAVLPSPPAETGPELELDAAVAPSTPQTLRTTPAR